MFNVKVLCNFLKRKFISSKIKYISYYIRNLDANLEKELLLGLKINNKFLIA